MSHLTHFAGIYKSLSVIKLPKNLNCFPTKNMFKMENNYLPFYGPLL